MCVRARERVCRRASERERERERESWRQTTIFDVSCVLFFLFPQKCEIREEHVGAKEMGKKLKKEIMYVYLCTCMYVC